MKGRLRDIFNPTDDKDEQISYHSYLQQLMVNGQLSAFRQTLEDLKHTSLINCLAGIAVEAGHKSIWVSAIRDEIICRINK